MYIQTGRFLLELLSLHLHLPSSAVDCFFFFWFRHDTHTTAEGRYCCCVPFAKPSPTQPSRLPACIKKGMCM